MSYSRWPHSAWYTYRDCASGNLRYNQILTINYSIEKCYRFYYYEFKAEKYNKVVDILKFIREDSGCESEELYELNDLVNIFLSDVEGEYNFTRVLLTWFLGIYYPTRNKFKRWVKKIFKKRNKK